MTTLKSPNPRMPGTRRMIGRTLQWMKAKQAALDAAHFYKRPGEDAYRTGEVRRGTGSVWHWKKAQQAAADAARVYTVPGTQMYHRAAPALASTAWRWNRARNDMMPRVFR